MDANENINDKSIKREKHRYSKEEKERYVLEYLKISSNCSQSQFARDNNIKLNTFQYWIKKHTSKNNLLKPVDIKPLIDNKLFFIIINNIKIETDERALKTIIGEIIHDRF